MKRILFAALFSLLCIPLHAQRERTSDYVKVLFTPDHADWQYKKGEDVKFTVSVIKDNYPQKNADVKWEWGADMHTPTQTGSINTASGHASLKFKGAKEPGFMTLKGTVTVDEVQYTNYVTVGFEPLNIKTTTKLPSDFMEFWQSVLDKSSRVPLEPLMTLQPDKCTPHANVYHVRFQNTAKGQYIYGMLAIPKGEGPFPAVLRVPGAGVRHYEGNTNWAKDGVIYLEIGIHGVPVNLDPQIYIDLRANALSNYNTSHIDDRDKYYYKKVYAGCVKAVDFLCSLPQTDADRIAVCGGSQGGALSIVTAGLDERIKVLYADYPALSEIGGFYYGRTGGWPKIFRDPKETNLATKVKVSEYYDVVNFARFIKVPILFGVSYNDMVCPPTSTMAAYNVIEGPKELFRTNDPGHWRYPEHSQKEKQWLLERLKK